mgnify:CR=1 FL=1
MTSAVLYLLHRSSGFEDTKLENSQNHNNARLNKSCKEHPMPIFVENPSAFNSPSTSRFRQTTGLERYSAPTTKGRKGRHSLLNTLAPLL